MKAIFHSARSHVLKIKEICNYVEAHFEGYNLHRTLAEIRPDYGFRVSCQTSVPESIISYLEADSYTSAIRNAISLLVVMQILWRVWLEE